MKKTLDYKINTYLTIAENHFFAGDKEKAGRIYEKAVEMSENNSYFLEEETKARVKELRKVFPKKLTVDNKIMTYLEMAQRLHNSNNVEAGSRAYGKAWKLYIDNMDNIEENTMKCVLHLWNLFHKKKTYGSEYSKKCYRVEDKILTREYEIWSND